MMIRLKTRESYYQEIILSNSITQNYRHQNNRGKDLFNTIIFYTELPYFSIRSPMSDNTSGVFIFVNFM